MLKSPKRKDLKISQRGAIALYEELKSQKKVAETLGVSVTTVQKAIYKGRAELL